MVDTTTATGRLRRSESGLEPQQRTFWSLRQLSQRWNVGERTIWRWIAQGDLAAVKFGPKLTRVSDDERRRREEQAGFRESVLRRADNILSQ